MDTGRLIATFDYSDQYKKERIIVLVTCLSMTFFLSVMIFMGRKYVINPRTIFDIFSILFLFFSLSIILYGLVSIWEERYQIYENGIFVRVPKLFCYLRLKDKFFLPFENVDKIELMKTITEKRIVLHRKKAFIRELIVRVEEWEKAYQATIDAWESWKKKNQHLINSQAEI